jgi:hypothetical protein
MLNILYSLVHQKRFTMSYSLVNHFESITCVIELYTHIHTCIHKYTYAHIRTYTHTNTHTHTYTHIYTPIHTHIHTYTHIHIYILTYIHTHPSPMHKCVCVGVGGCVCCVCRAQRENMVEHKRALVRAQMLKLYTYV